MSHEPRHLSAEEIDATLKTMRDNPSKRWVSRGRGGNGLQFRDGKFWVISIDEGHELTDSFDDDDAFRTFLAELDVAKENRGTGYYRAILLEMGTLPGGVE